MEPYVRALAARNALAPACVSRRALISAPPCLARHRGTLPQRGRYDAAPTGRARVLGRGVHAFNAWALSLFTPNKCRVTTPRRRAADNKHAGRAIGGASRLTAALDGENVDGAAHSAHAVAHAFFGHSCLHLRQLLTSTMAHHLRKIDAGTHGVDVMQRACTPSVADTPRCMIWCACTKRYARVCSGLRAFTRPFCPAPALLRSQPATC
jgi:hypothetical protein